MDCRLALLLLCLLKVFSCGGAIPLPRDDPAVTFMRKKVKHNAEQLVERIDQFLEVWFHNKLIISPGADPLNGLSSIVVVLEGYERLLSRSFDLAQVNQEVFSLRVYLEHWRQGHCDQQQRQTPPVQGRLALLQSWTKYPETVGREALVRLREYLSRLLSHLEYLGTC